MTFLKNFIVLTFISTALAFNNEYTKAKHSAEADLLKLMSKSLLTRNPNQSMMGCFAYYNPKMSEIMEVYEQKNNKCNKVADEARKAADATTVEQRKELDVKATAACGAVSQCKSADTPQSTYECYINGGSLNSKSMKDLSADASGKLVVFQKTLRNIDSEEKICVTDNKLEYERNWDKCYDEFTDCINGITTVPTTPTSNS